MSASSSLSSSSSIISSNFVPMPTTGLITATGSAPFINPTASNIPDPLSPSTFSTIFSSIPSSTSTATAVPTNSASPKLSLSKGQLAVVVSGPLVFVVAVALFACYCWRRRKRGNKRPRDSDASFGGSPEAAVLVERRPNPSSGIVAALDRFDHSSSPIGPQVSKAQQVLGGPFPLNQSRPSPTRRHTPVEDIGLAVTPEALRRQNMEDTPPSATSYRTTSKLLPDKPTYSLFPSSTSPPRESPIGTENVVIRPPEDVSILLRYPDRSKNPPRQDWRSIDTSQATLQGINQPQDSRDPFVESFGGPRAYSRSPRNQFARDGTMNFPNYGNSWAQVERSLQPQQRQRANQSAIPRSGLFQPMPPSQVLNSALYPSRPYPPEPNANTQAQSFKYDSYPRRSRRERPATYLTTGSETEFEDEGGDDGGNDVEPDSALSPVTESPINRPPLSELRYPNIKEHEPSLPTPARKPVARTRPNPSTQNLSIQNPPRQTAPLRSSSVQNLLVRNPPIQIIDVSPNRALPPPPLFGERSVNRSEPQPSNISSTRPLGPRPYMMTASKSPKLSAKQQILFHPSMEALEPARPTRTDSRGARTPLGGRLPNGERRPIAGTMRGGEKTPISATPPSLTGRRPQGATARY
ncbi:MAG: hypothetical protein MMC33_001602 [Icmadophila ericetorum]|nr:hypothetical protein [Icmadophila ericetorum]